MALLVAGFELESGIAIENAYARVDGRSGGNKEPLTFALNYYISQDACENGKAYVKQEHFTFTASVEDGAPNDIKQCYEHLKTLELFLTALDC